MEVGMTQEDLAARLGLPVQNVARVEQGKVDIRVSTLLRIAKGLGLQDDPGLLLQRPTIKKARPGRPPKAT